MCVRVCVCVCVFIPEFRILYVLICMFLDDLYMLTFVHFDQNVQLPKIVVSLKSEDDIGMQVHYWLYPGWWGCAGHKLSLPGRFC